MVLNDSPRENVYSGRDGRQAKRGLRGQPKKEIESKESRKTIIYLCTDTNIGKKRLINYVNTSEYLERN